MEHHKVEANGVMFHVAVTGTGPALYLLHGWPQTSHEWHKVVPQLAEHYTVVTPDIRGLGSTSRPATGYDAHTLGDDVAALAAALGHDEISIAAHDWGGMLGYACAHRHRQLVRRLAIYDFSIPGLGQLEQLMAPKEGPGYIWHLGFQSVPDIAPMLITGREREYLNYFFRNFAYDPTAITPQDLDIYVDALQQVGALRAGMQYYVNQYRMGEQVREFAKDKIDIPVLGYGGAASMGDLVKENLSLLANDVRGGTVERAGHWIPEERPDFVVESLIDFLP